MGDLAGAGLSIMVVGILATETEERLPRRWRWAGSKCGLTSDDASTLGRVDAALSPVPEFDRVAKGRSRCATMSSSVTKFVVLFGMASVIVAAGNSEGVPGGPKTHVERGSSAQHTMLTSAPAYLQGQWTNVTDWKNGLRDAVLWIGSREKGKMLCWTQMGCIGDNVVPRYQDVVKR